MVERSDKPIVLPVPVPGDTQGNIGPERRGQDRIPFTAAADVFEVRSQTRVAGRCSDLSRGGCYVDTLTPFAVGAAVRVRIEREKRGFEAMAVVAYAHVSMGMGLAFTEVKPEHKTILNSWITELTGEKASAPAPGAEPASAVSTGEIVDPRLVLNALIHLLYRKQLISESEATELLRQMFR